MEGWLALLDLVLIIDDIENAGAKLGSDLTQDSIGFQTLNYQIFQFVHDFLFSINILQIWI